MIRCFLSRGEMWRHRIRKSATDMLFRGKKCPTVILTCICLRQTSLHTGILVSREEKCAVIASAHSQLICSSCITWHWKNLLKTVTLARAMYTYVWTRNAEGGGGGGGRLHTIHPLRRWLISSARTAVSYVCYSSVSTCVTRVLVWPIPTSMLLERKRNRNTINDID